MNEFIELIVGGKKHLFFTKHILLIKEINVDICEISILDFDKPFEIEITLKVLLGMIEKE